MKKRKISLILASIMILNILFPSFSLAARIMDYRELVDETRLKIGYYETPIANFEVYLNGSYFGRTNVTRSTSFANSAYDIQPHHQTAKVGDKVTLRDLSQTGSGSKIRYYDLQVAYYKPTNKAGGSDEIKTYTSMNTTINFDKAGTYIIFLNVSDNYSIPGGENFSQYGNFRTSAPKIMPGTSYDIEIRGWYFTAFKIIVEDLSKNAPKAEFSIWHNNQNKTDNLYSPVKVDKLPTSVNLQDESIAGTGTITSYKWSVYKNNSWVQFSTAKSPTYSNVTDNMTRFRLEVTDSSGKSASVEHSFYVTVNNEPPYVPPPPPITLPDSTIEVTARIENVYPTSAPLGTMAEADFTFTITSTTYSISNYVITKGVSFVDDDTTKSYPLGTHEVTETLRLRFEVGRDITVAVRAFDTQGAYDEDEDSVSTESINPDIEVYSWISGLPEAADSGELVTGYYNFEATSTVYDLDEWSISSGFNYVIGSDEGYFEGRNHDEVSVPIEIPAGKTIYMGVTAYDEGGYSARHNAEAFVRAKVRPTLELNVLTPQVMYREDAKFSVNISENDYSLHRYKWYINPINDPTGQEGSVKSGDGIIPSVMEMDIPVGEYKVIQEGYYYDSTGERKVSDIKSITVIPSLEVNFIAVPYKQVADKDILLINKSINYTSEKWWIKEKGKPDSNYVELVHSNYKFTRPIGEYTVKLEVFNPNLRVNYASMTKDVEFLGIPVVDFLLSPDLLFVNEISVITDLSENVTNKQWWIKDVKDLKYVPFIDLYSIGNNKYEFTKEDFAKFKNDGKEEYTVKLTADGKLAFDVYEYLYALDKESLLVDSPYDVYGIWNLEDRLVHRHWREYDGIVRLVEDSIIWFGDIEPVYNDYYNFKRPVRATIYVEAHMFKERAAIFKYPTPVADFSLTDLNGNDVNVETKVYKQLQLSGEYESIIATNSKDIDILLEGRKPTNYPIRFNSKFTRFRIKPISVSNFDPLKDIDSDKTITAENGIAYISGVSGANIRINKPGVYEISYQVYNGKSDSDFKEYHLSDWSLPKKINVQPDIDPIVEELQIVTTNYSNLFRDFENKMDLKTEVEFDVVLRTLDDDYIDLNNTAVMISFDKDSNGIFNSSDDIHLKQYIWLDDNVTDVYKDITNTNTSNFSKLEIMDNSSTTEKYIEKVEVKQLANNENRYIKLRLRITISNTSRNILGNFKVEVKTAKKLKVKDWVNGTSIKSPVANFGEYTYTNVYRTNAIDNFFDSIREPRTGDSSLIHISNKKFSIINNAPTIENIMKREKFLEVWITEAGTNPFTQSEIKSILTQFKNNGIIARIGVISINGSIVKYDLDSNGDLIIVD